MNALANNGERRPSHWFIRSMDRLNGWFVKLCGLAMIAMVVSVTVGILIRFIFSHLSMRVSAPWTEEVSRYLMIWTVFIGAGVASRTGKLIGVEALMLVLPAWLGRSVKYVSHVVSVAFYILLCWVGWQWLEFGQSQTSPVMQVPLAVVNTAMLCGAMLLILNTAALVLEVRLTGRDIRHANVDDEMETALEQAKELQQ